MSSSLASVVLLASAILTGTVANPVTIAARATTSSTPNCSGGTTSSNGAVVLGSCKSLDLPTVPSTATATAKTTTATAKTTTALPLPVNPTSSRPVVFLPPPPEPSGIATVRPTGYTCNAPERFLVVQVMSNLESLIPSQQIIINVLNSSDHSSGKPLGFYQGSCYLGRYGFNNACDWISHSDWKYPVEGEVVGAGAAKGGKYTIEHSGFDAFDEYHDNVVLGGFGPGAGSCAWQNLGDCTASAGQAPGNTAIQSMNARCYQSGKPPGTIPSAASLAPSVTSYVSRAMHACSDATKACVPSTSLKSGQTQTITINSACDSAMKACATL